jgi:hypothetical protein
LWRITVPTREVLDRNVTMSLRKLTEEEMNITMRIHAKGSTKVKCHIGKKADVKEFDIGIAQLKEKSSMMRKLLQERLEED